MFLGDKAVAVAFSVLVLVACRPPLMPDPEVPDPGSVAMATRIFVPVAGDPSTLEFYTNDPQYLGKSLFRVGTQEIGGATWEVSSDVRKPFGMNTTGYGMVFSFQDSRNYMVFLINRNSEYCVVKVKEGLEVAPRPLEWNTTHHLRSGGNRLRVNYHGGGRFEVFINDIGHGEFLELKDLSLYESGRAGFLAVISSQERFPYEFVQVLATQVTPPPGSWGMVFPSFSYMSRAIGQANPGRER